MATQAFASYTAGKYSEALSHLSNLSVASTRSPGADGSAPDTSNDFRTKHNTALCEHGARGFTDPAALETTLRSIQSRLAEASGGSSGGGSGNSDGEHENDDPDRERTRTSKRGSSSSSRATAATGALLVGASGGARSAATAAAGLADLDADASVLLYNLSALRFQQKQYGAAQAVLERLFLHIEPLDDSLAIHICLLLLDVLCHSARGNLHTEDNLRRFAAQTAAVLAFLERPHALNSPSSGGGDR